MCAAVSMGHTALHEAMKSANSLPTNYVECKGKIYQKRSPLAFSRDGKRHAILSMEGRDNKGRGHESHSGSEFSGEWKSHDYARADDETASEEDS